MPIVNCLKCGHKTNSALCRNWWDPKKATCILKWVDGKWEKGCGYNDAGLHDRSYADSLLKNQEEPDIGD